MEILEQLFHEDPLDQRFLYRAPQNLGRCSATVLNQFLNIIQLFAIKYGFSYTKLSHILNFLLELLFCSLNICALENLELVLIYLHLEYVFTVMVDGITKFSDILTKTFKIWAEILLLDGYKYSVVEYYIF